MYWHLHFGWLSCLTSGHYSLSVFHLQGTKDEVMDHMKRELSDHLRLVAQHWSDSSAKYSELKQKFEIEAKRAGNLEQVVRVQGILIYECE